jgi:hypothetical protein
MARMGHVSTRDALVYLHDTDDRQRAIATVISDLARPGLGQQNAPSEGLRRMQRAREGHDRPTSDLRPGVSPGQVFTFGVDLRFWGLIEGLPTG